MTASTIALPASAAHLVPKGYEMGIFGTPMTASIATTSIDEVNDSVELGYIPGNCIVLGVLVQATSMAASGLVIKIQINGSDFVTGITTLVAGGGALFFPNAPLAIAGGAPQKLAYIVTTQATTPAAGTLSVTPILVNQ